MNILPQEIILEILSFNTKFLNVAFLNKEFYSIVSTLPLNINFIYEEGRHISQLLKNIISSVTINFFDTEFLDSIKDCSTIKEIVFDKSIGHNYILNYMAGIERITYGISNNTIYIPQEKKIKIWFQNTITDESLHKLCKLKYLMLNSCDIKDDTLSKMQNMEHLQLCDCENISNNSLQYLKNIKILSIFGCPKVSCSIFRYLPKLTNVDVNNCDISSDELAYLYNAENFKICDSKVSDISLAYLSKTNIKTLNIRRCNNITDKSVSTLKTLEVLHINECDNISGSCFSKLPNLIHLYLFASKVTDDNIIDLPNLKLLSVDNCSLLTDKCLKKQENLKYLIMRNIRNITMEGMSYLPISIKITSYNCKNLK